MRHNYLERAPVFFAPNLRIISFRSNGPLFQFRDEDVSMFLDRWPALEVSDDCPHWYLFASPYIKGNVVQRLTDWMKLRFLTRFLMSIEERQMIWVQGLADYHHLGGPTSHSAFCFRRLPPLWIFVTLVLSCTAGPSENMRLYSKIVMFLRMDWSSQQKGRMIDVLVESTFEAYLARMWCVVYFCMINFVSDVIIVHNFPGLNISERSSKSSSATDQKSNCKCSWDSETHIRTRQYCKRYVQGLKEGRLINNRLTATQLQSEQPQISESYWRHHWWATRTFLAMKHQDSSQRNWPPLQLPPQWAHPPDQPASKPTIHRCISSAEKHLFWLEGAIHTMTGVV